MITDYFAVRPKIVEALIQAFTADDSAPFPVFTPANVQAMLQITNIAPAAHVIYMDDRVDGSAGNGSASTFHQQWLVVLCVRDAESQLQSTEALQAAASPYILKLLEALQGFEPTGGVGFGPLKRATAGATHGIEAGLGWFPFLFETQVFI